MLHTTLAKKIICDIQVRLHFTGPNQDSLRSVCVRVCVYIYI